MLNATNALTASLIFSTFLIPNIIAFIAVRLLSGERKENDMTISEKGWECPKCGAIMSPTTSVCVNCRGDSDAVVVVRCKDCEYNRIGSCEFGESCNEQYNPNFYCADGYRKSL